MRKMSRGRGRGRGSGSGKGRSVGENDERSRFGFPPVQYDARWMLTILFLGDVVGEPGRCTVIAQLPRLKELHAPDFVIVNGENAAGGRGSTPKITLELRRA